VINLQGFSMGVPHPDARSGLKEETLPTLVNSVGTGNSHALLHWFLRTVKSIVYIEVIWCCAQNM